MSTCFLLRDALLTGARYYGMGYAGTAGKLRSSFVSPSLTGADGMQV